MGKHRLILFLSFGTIGILGFLFILWITPFGSGVNPDSTIYMGGAKSLVAGEGFTLNGSLITHYPPFYSMMLAVMSIFENRLIQSARFLNAILYGTNLMLCGYVVYLSAGRNPFAAAFAVLFFFTTAPFLEIHAWAWSEPLFIALSLNCITLLSVYVTRPTLLTFIGSSLVLGFTMLTRYVGAAFLPVALAMVFLARSGRPTGRKLLDAFLWLLVAITPLGIFFIEQSVDGKFSDKSSSRVSSDFYDPVCACHHHPRVGFHHPARASTPGQARHPRLSCNFAHDSVGNRF